MKTVSGGELTRICAALWPQPFWDAATNLKWCMSTQIRLPRRWLATKLTLCSEERPILPGAEIGSQISPVDIVYYDQQMFLAKNAEKATSMEAFKGKKVCTVMNSEELYNLEQYSEKYDLGFAPLLFPSAQKAKEAFLLNRCPLLTGNAMFLRNVMQTNVSKDTKIELLPEIIAVKPSYLLAAKDNETLRITLKWVLNALKLAEEKDITSQNIDVFTGIRDTATKNLLGSDPKLWKRFSLNPQWVRKAVKEQGNYGEILNATWEKTHR